MHPPFPRPLCSNSTFINHILMGAGAHTFVQQVQMLPGCCLNCPLACAAQYCCPCCRGPGKVSCGAGKCHAVAALWRCELLCRDTLWLPCCPHCPASLLLPAVCRSSTLETSPAPLPPSPPLDHGSPLPSPVADHHKPGHLSPRARSRQRGSASSCHASACQAAHKQRLHRRLGLLQVQQQQRQQQRGIGISGGCSAQRQAPAPHHAPPGHRALPQPPRVRQPRLPAVPCQPVQGALAQGSPIRDPHLPRFTLTPA